MPARRSPSSLQFRGARANRLRTELLTQLPIRCPLCGLTFTDANEVEVDHILSIAEGGAAYDRANLRLLCMPCNRGRGMALVHGIPFTAPKPQREPAPRIVSSRIW
jgi:5-methylcytosine-specific restriction endonuclease McrA